jgi:hypothetical protein
MKKIINILLATLVLTSVSTISAYAGEEHATYAVVNSSGVVTNVIVCSAATCGPEGAWKATMPSDTDCPGCKLVLQVPANPITGQHQGSVFTQNPTPEQVVRYDSQAQVFTQGSGTTPMPVTRTETVDTSTLVATINSTQVTFGPDNFVDGQMIFDPKVTPTTGATLSAIQGLATEVIVFETPKTRSQIQASIENKLKIMQQYLNRFYVLLNGWLID